jgi:hypothetical protein
MHYQKHKRQNQRVAKNHAAPERGKFPLDKLSLLAAIID